MELHDEILRIPGCSCSLYTSEMAQERRSPCLPNTSIILQLLSCHQVEVCGRQNDPSQLERWQIGAVRRCQKNAHGHPAEL
jgi:hypothetical protein